MTSFGLDGKIAVELLEGSERQSGVNWPKTVPPFCSSTFWSGEAAEVAADLQKEYPQAKFHSIKADLSKKAEVERVGDFYAKHFDCSPDVVCNNAAICRMGEWAEVPDEEFDEVLAANLKSVHMDERQNDRLGSRVLLEVSQHFARMALEQKRPQSIVQTASFTAYAGVERLSAYVAAKAGVIGLMRVMSKELGPKGIRVNCVCPGYILTPMSSAHADEQRFAEIASKVPLRRIGEPEEVANLVLFLASNLSSYCHGSCYDVHGRLHHLNGGEEADD
ncbi:Estradiol 17-beta-dehydrogenase 8 [Aphelenchoides fujianensis]|nr:Estradiol 17-beta-dehydrogenase 8 [Aphelenchoides fujianensis]